MKEKGAPVRSAMFYPRIHFPNVEWVKATLLTFGRIHRIVPRDHPRDRDPPEVSRYSTWDEDDHENVIVNVDPDHQDIELAQARIDDLIARTDPKDLHRRFGPQTVETPYEIYRSKIHDGLFSQLVEHNLVWDARGNQNFLAMHPSLGEAIMGVSAIRTARRTASDVVTSEPSLHEALAAVDEDALLDSVFAPTLPVYADVPPSRAAAHLAHAVLTTRIDLSKIGMRDIVKMAREGADLRAFRKMLTTLVEDLPPELDQKTRDARIAALVDKVIAEWKEFERRLSKKMKTLAKQAAAETAKMAAVSAVTGLALGGVQALLASAITTDTIVTGIAAAGVPFVLNLIWTALTHRSDVDETAQFRFLSQLLESGGSILAVPRSYRPRT